MNAVYYSIKSMFVVALLCLPACASGQFLKKEQVKVTVDSSPAQREYAVVYAEGLAKGAIWPLGTVLTTNDGYVTIRHQVARGNGGNLSVNDRVSSRFIVAPTDHPDNYLWWSDASGFLSSQGSASLNETFSGTPTNKGCAIYHTQESGKGRKWRLPTQRELQLIWLLRAAVDIVYAVNASPFSREPMSDAPYWSSTEKDAENAWAVDFNPGNFRTYTETKNSSNAKVRCVSDY